MSLSPASNGIGQPVRRREDLRLLTGRGRYSDDINVPGQAYAVMVRSPHAHALIRVDRRAAAMRAPGVLAVLTGRDMLADGLKPIPHAVRTSHPADIQLEQHGRVAAVHSAALSDGRRRGAPCRRHRRHGGRHQPRRGEGCRRTASWSTTPTLPAVVHSRAGNARGCSARLVGRRIELLPRRQGRRRARDRRGVRRRRACRALQHLGAAHRRRDDGAARRDRRIRPGNRALHAARRRRRRGAPAARPGGGARRRGR